MAAAHARQVGSERECPHPVVYSSLSCCSQNILPLSRPAAEAHISSSVGESFPGAAACAAYNALWGARVVTVHTSGHEREFGGIPAITYSRYPSLRRIQCSGSIMLPLHDLAGYTQLHGLRELVCSTFLHYDLFQLQHAQPLSQLEVLDFTRMQTAAGADNSLAAAAGAQLEGQRPARGAGQPVQPHPPDAPVARYNRRFRRMAAPAAAARAAGSQQR